MTQAAALPLGALTGDQLMRGAAEAQRGQTMLVAGALGSVSRMATFAGLRMGARVIAGVRLRELDEARTLPGVMEVIALDAEVSLEKLGKVDAVANTLAGDIVALFTYEGSVIGFCCKEHRDQFESTHANIVRAVANDRMKSQKA